MECRQKANLKDCTCTYSGCERKGICCDCLQYHLARRQLPGCCFPPEAEDQIVQVHVNREVLVYTDSNGTDEREVFEHNAVAARHPGGLSFGDTGGGHFPGPYRLFLFFFRRPAASSESAVRLFSLTLVDLQAVDQDRFGG